MMDDEIHYQILKLLQEQPDMSQRDLAARLGVSLGKTNYCLKELVKKGIVKAGRFSSNPDKRVYAYLLTPRGIKEKANLTVRFLQRKMHEYERIKEEIATLKSEIGEIEANNTPTADKSSTTTASIR